MLSAADPTKPKCKLYNYTTNPTEMAKQKKQIYA